MTVLAAFLFFIAAICLAFVAEEHRHYFGKFSGNIVLAAEATVCVVAWVVVTLLRHRQRALGLCVALWGAAGLFAFLAWFVHPEQVISRAEERIGDTELAASLYRDEQTYGVRDADSAVRFQRLATELAARKLEYQAALTRYNGDPAFFRSSFATWTLGIAAAVATILGVVMLRMRARDLRPSAS